MSEARNRADFTTLTNRNGGAFSSDSRYTTPHSRAPQQGGGLTYPAFGAPSPPPSLAVLAPPPPSRAPDLVEEARGQGFARGHAEGYAQAEHEALARDAARAKFAFSFERIDAHSAEQLRQRLMATVVALCEATLAPMALDKDALARRVERAVAMFSRADDDRVIRLNAQDMAALKDTLPAEWTFSVDDTLEPGALRVETSSRGADGGGVGDGPRQWRRAIAEALDLGNPEADAGMDGAC